MLDEIAGLSRRAPVESKQMEIRYLNIYEGGQFDKTQSAAWVKQARESPGWVP